MKSIDTDALELAEAAYGEKGEANVSEADADPRLLTLNELAESAHEAEMRADAPPGAEAPTPLRLQAELSVTVPWLVEHETLVVTTGEH